MERVRIPEKMLLGQTSYADFSFGLGVVCGSKSVQSMEGWGPVQELNLSLRTTRTLPLTNQKQF